MTHVESKSRYLIAGKLLDKKALSMTSESIAHFRKVPKRLRATLTVDNGKEFSQFKEIEKRTGLAVYFADPYAAWQRGTNDSRCLLAIMSLKIEWNRRTMKLWE
jgi:IS30 family transposase